jgi:maltose O-acetyltransferase
MSKIRQLFSMMYRFFYPLSLVELYKRMGVEIGEGCKFQFEVNIDYSHYWLISIGNNVTLAPRVHILAHDASTKLHLGYTKTALVRIEDNVFIGAGTIVLPGVKIGKNSIIGAGSVVTKDVPENTVAAGNPVKVIKSLDAFLDEHRLNMVSEICFDESFTIRKNINDSMKKEMIETINSTGYAYVE